MCFPKAWPSGKTARIDFNCPRTGFVTGAVNNHEIELDRDGRAVFVNTQYSCLAVPDMNASFKPLW